MASCRGRGTSSHILLLSTTTLMIVFISISFLLFLYFQSSSLISFIPLKSPSIHSLSRELMSSSIWSNLLQLTIEPITHLRVCACCSSSSPLSINLTPVWVLLSHLLFKVTTEFLLVFSSKLSCRNLITMLRTLALPILLCGMELASKTKLQALPWLAGRKEAIESCFDTTVGWQMMYKLGTIWSRWLCSTAVTILLYALDKDCGSLWLVE